LRFFIPNAYTPNENSLNERFQPEGMYYLQSYEMKIYNRYGQKIYDNNECLNSWDGTFNGEIVSDGVYAYSINVVDLKGEVCTFNGTIHLMR
jgi:gliding motility-associated-like protein